MQFGSLDDFLGRGRQVLAAGPVALILAEDEVELASTIAHHQGLGFRQILVVHPAAVATGLGPDMTELGTLVHDIRGRDAVPDLLTRIAAAAPPATWLYWGYNAEYLFFPFCDSRSVAEMLAFHAEERRSAMVAHLVDLYAADLDRHPDAVCRDEAMFDRSGYYSAARYRDGRPMDRQTELFGGIRWRFEEHIPAAGRRLDRVALFRPAPDLAMRPDFTFTDEEMNTIACPWHHNLTAVVASFRTAKALRANPGSREAIRSFRWPGSVRFDWSPRQLLDMGLMEPGQWF